MICTRKVLHGLTIVALLSMASSACSSEPLSPFLDTPDVVGKILQVESHELGRRLLVEQQGGSYFEQHGGSVIWITIISDTTVSEITVIFDLRSGSPTPVTAAALQTGLQVELTSTGPIQESDPPQAVADTLGIRS